MDVSFSVPVEFRHCASYCFAFVIFLNTDQSNFEKFLSVFQDVQGAKLSDKGTAL